MYLSQLIESFGIFNQLLLVQALDALESFKIICFYTHSPIKIRSGFFCGFCFGILLKLPALVAKLDLVVKLNFQDHYHSN